MTLLALAAAAVVQIAVEPAKLQLGTDERARVVVQLPAGASDLRVSVSTGALKVMEQKPDGSFAGEYTPPDETVPQVAIFTAVARFEGAPLVATATLPLWGQGDAVVTTRKFATIEVRIGDRVFGPVKAGADGTALVPVVVPPGVFAAMHGERAIDLHLPPVQRALVTVGRASIRADRTEKVRVFVAAVAPSGDPAPSPEFALAIDRGELSSPERIAPGLWSAEWKFDAGPIGSAHVVATLDGIAARAEVQLVAGPAASISLAADRERIVAGQAELPLHAMAVDAAGNASPERLEFSTDLGDLKAVPSGTGRWDLHLAIPSSFGGRSELRVVASGTQAKTALQVPLASGAPASASIEPVLRAAHADGWTAVPLRIALADRFGNPVPDASPVAVADRGHVREVEPDRPGVYVATYVPPLSREGGAALVSVRAGDVSVRTRIPLQPHDAFVAVSPKLGVTSNFKDLTSPVVAIEGAVRTDHWGPQLALVADLAWWSATASDSLVVSPTSVAAVKSRSDFVAATLALQWRFSLGTRTTGFVHAGPTITHLWSHLRVTGQPTAYDTATVPGGEASVGFERRMWGGAPFVEARWSFASDPALHGVLSGPMRAWSFSAGWRFEML